MKLHTLKIQAFGPFANKEVVDFSKLGENPLFLIDGPTGAGKSSILHAICYALYGETTDSERGSLGLRCDHAADDVLTELSLKFSIKGDRYRISRVPLQMRPAMRGGGETEQKATAHLCRIRDDGSEETIGERKIKSTNDEIAKIVGLTSDQFLQVMVLPQGKFRALLLAKSDDRQDILSKLFQTEIYKHIEQVLKDKAGSIKQQNEVFEGKKKDALLDVKVEDIRALVDAIKMAKQVLVKRQKEKESVAHQNQKKISQLEAAKAISELFEERKNNQKILEDNLLETDKIDALRARIKLAEKAFSINPKWTSLQAILSNIQDKNDEVTQRSKDCKAADLQVTDAACKVKKAKNLYEQRDPLKAKENEIKAFQEKLIEFEPLKQASSTADSKHQAALDKKAKLEKKNNTIDATLKALMSEIEILSDEVSYKSQVVEKKMVAKSRYERRNQLELAQDELCQLNADYEAKKQAHERADEIYKEDEKEANRIEMLWFANQAAVLATKLEENKPCVVCGSLEHPRPATFTSGLAAITQKAVDKARSDESDSRDKMSAAKSNMADCLHLVKDKQKEIGGFEKELEEAASKTVSDVEEVFRGLELKLKTIEEKEEQLSKAKKRQADKIKEREPIILALKSLDEELPTLTAQKATANSQLSNASKSLPEEYRDAQTIDRAILEIQKKIEKLDSELRNANQEQTNALTHQSATHSTLKQLNEDLKKLQERSQALSLEWERTLADSHFTTQKAFESAHMSEESLDSLRQEVRQHDDRIKDLKTRHEVLDKQLKGKERPELDKLKKEVKELQIALEEKEISWSLAQQQKNKLEDTQIKIKKLETQQSDIKKQYDIVGALSKAASGRGNVKVSLERFVLGNILDSVLSIASQRLHTMSRGQYQLIRQNEEDQKRNIPTGLDLAIDDAYTGKIRPVATLSGGESFMASLALALALSDVVQERSGGIQLDTLFVDEGFGSLDQESLQLAIDILVDLQSTGRTIGIISHVSELKEQMALRVDVTGSREGSSIRAIA